MRDVTAHPVLARVGSIELYCRPDLNGFYSAFDFVKVASGGEPASIPALPTAALSSSGFNIGSGRKVGDTYLLRPLARFLVDAEEAFSRSGVGSGA
ncbi:hypothetical protein GCM10028796_13120 [Ramlibacter monticola]|uniref:Uncharacterized protein n=1 Tax=Ramlibacter monticola TaxID=1926872 RepID=A0A936YYD5_9BURK|nr:hypothetical protein [Ramlibacter monticola]MBL0390157.1 hypothetical protein [Ramlibacter monticola]